MILFGGLPFLKIVSCSALKKQGEHKKTHLVSNFLVLKNKENTENTGSIWFPVF